MPRFRGLRRLFRHRDPARELEDEIGFHLETRVDELTALGVPREEASRRAAAEFGDRERYRRETAAVDAAIQRTAVLSSLRMDLVHALRVLRRAPGFSLTVIVSLGISIAATTTVFSLADAVLLRALPFRDPEALVWIASVRPQRTDAPLSLPEFIDYSSRTRTVDIAALANWNAAMETETQTRRLQGLRLSANTFEVLGAVPSAGRPLRREDDRPDAPRVVMLSHRFWMAEFGGDGGVVGRMLRLNGEQHQVVGVLPRHFPLPVRNVDLVVSLQPELDARRTLRNSVNFLRLFGRIRPTASIDAARQDLGAIANDLRGEFPTEYATKLGIAVTPMQEFLVGDTRTTFVVMLGAVGLLLAIALANVLNLLLIRGTARKGEMALRRALGGTRRHLAVGATSEAAILAIMGAVAGALLSAWLVSSVASSSIAVLRLDEARVASRTLIFVTLVSLLATLLFSVIQLGPALRTAPKEALAAIARVHGSRGEARLRSVLLVVQLGFAVMLTIVTATMARSFARLQAVDLGFRPDSTYVAMVSLPPQKYGTVADLTGFTEAFAAALRATPGVVQAGVVSIAPLTGLLASVPFSVVGRPPADPNERLNANFRAISPGYFRSIGAALISGRDFATSDGAAAPPAAIVSRAFAERYLGDGDPLGQQIMVNDNNDGPRPLTVVGVLDHVRHVAIDGAPTFDVYIPMAQVHRDGLEFAAGRQFWTVRVAGVDDVFSRTFGRVLAGVDKDVALAGVQPMRRYVDDALGPRRFSVLALLGFAGVALLLAAIGVYGVVAYSVEQRRREIGLRLALGASASNVARTFVAPALAMTIVGVAGGIAGAWLARQLVAGLLFGVSPTEPQTMAFVGLALVATSALAAAVPAYRATTIAPAIALANDN